MLGVDAALAAGLQRRYGWQIVAWSGCAAALPDWDGLTLAFGIRCFDAGHRVWGHNLLVAGLAGLALGAGVCWSDLFTRAAQAVAGRRRSIPDSMPEQTRRSAGALVVWALVGMVASYSHLAMDLVFSSGNGLPVWEVPLCWPFWKRGWAWPMVPWGDPAPSILFAAGMLAMAGWPRKTRLLAGGTLGLVAAYIVVRGLAG